MRTTSHRLKDHIQRWLVHDIAFIAFNIHIVDSKYTLSTSFVCHSFNSRAIFSLSYSFPWEFRFLLFFLHPSVCQLKSIFSLSYTKPEQWIGFNLFGIQMTCSHQIHLPLALFIPCLPRVCIWNLTLNLGMFWHFRCCCHYSVPSVSMWMAHVKWWSRYMVLCKSGICYEKKKRVRRSATMTSKVISLLERKCKTQNTKRNCTNDLSALCCWCVSMPKSAELCDSNTTKENGGKSTISSEFAWGIK